MPELAEVEYFRKQWDRGLGLLIRSIKVHSGARPLRGLEVRELKAVLTGAKLIRSEARGKQMLFRFSRDSWLGIHLGMTGRLRCEPPAFSPGKHDHFVLVQARHSLVFEDSRQFGRMRFHRGKEAPAWWTALGAGVLSGEFTLSTMAEFLRRHRRLSIKAALLLQAGFPGIGNWMADEILWRAHLNPHLLAGHLETGRLLALYRTTRWVARHALRIVGHDFSDPPAGWLFNEKWKRGGVCPIHRTLLRKETLGGRTTAWCPQCQR